MNSHLDEKFDVPSRQGRLLCSPRDPVREAREWLSRQKVSSQDRTALLLGFGAGYHAKEIVLQYPNLNLKVFEIDPEFQKGNFHFIQNPVAEEYDLILAFRPSWACFEKEYLSQYLRLTGRDINPDEYFSSNDKSFSFDQKIWLCLRELVK